MACTSGWHLSPLFLERFEMEGKLVLEDKNEYVGKSFGFNKSIAGEVVFSTGMVGYPEAFTDPSYAGQILICTYPLIGNYGVPDKKYWESGRLQIAGLIVSTYNNTPSHFQAKKTLAEWLKDEKVPALEIKDTRLLTQKIREQGTMLGKIIIGRDVKLYDPNLDNLVAQVSPKKILKEGIGKRTVVLLDCGAKKNISRNILRRNVRLITVPWDTDIFLLPEKFDALIISNGPGDPKMAGETIKTVRTALKKRIPTLGVCLGNQLLALAAGGDTSKLKYGHRSQNQPCIMKGSNRCFITTQNHGFAVSRLPEGFSEWFVNANDGSNEGIRHKTLPFMSVQFHPEATPGPYDTEWIFDEFLMKV